MSTTERSVLACLYHWLQLIYSVIPFFMHKCMINILLFQFLLISWISTHSGSSTLLHMYTWFLDSHNIIDIHNLPAISAYTLITCPVILTCLLGFTAQMCLFWNIYCIFDLFIVVRTFFLKPMKDHGLPVSILHYFYDFIHGLLNNQIPWMVV